MWLGVKDAKVASGMGWRFVMGAYHEHTTSVGVAWPANRSLALGVVGVETDVGRGSRARVLPGGEVIQDPADHLGLGDEGNDSKCPAALTKEGVGLEDSSNQICPALSSAGAVEMLDIRTSEEYEERFGGYL